MLTLFVITWRYYFARDKEMSKNAENWRKSMKKANIDDKFSITSERLEEFL